MNDFTSGRRVVQNLSQERSRWENKPFLPPTAGQRQGTSGHLGKRGPVTTCSAQHQTRARRPALLGGDGKRTEVLSILQSPSMTNHTTPTRENPGISPEMKLPQTKPCPGPTRHRSAKQLSRASSSSWWQKKSWCLLSFFHCP